MQQALVSAERRLRPLGARHPPKVMLFGIFFIEVAFPSSGLKLATGTHAHEHSQVRGLNHARLPVCLFPGRTRLDHATIGTSSVLGSLQVPSSTEDVQAGQPQIFVAAADGSDEHPLLPNPDADYDSVWLPDGRSIVFASERNGSADLFRDCVHLNRKSYSGLSPVVDSLLRISTEAVFLLTRNCSSTFRALICLMKDRFFRSLHPASQTVLEKRMGLII